jgi:hypothetical protein
VGLGCGLGLGLLFYSSIHVQHFFFLFSLSSYLQVRDRGRVSRERRQRTAVVGSPQHDRLIHPRRGEHMELVGPGRTGHGPLVPVVFATDRQGVDGGEVHQVTIPVHAGSHQIVDPFEVG